MSKKWKENRWGGRPHAKKELSEQKRPWVLLTEGFDFPPRNMKQGLLENKGDGLGWMVDGRSVP